MFRAINISGNDRILAEEFAKYIETEHRTLVQSFFRMIQKIIKDYSKHKYWDFRNVGSLEWAKKVAELEYYMPLI